MYSVDDHYTKCKLNALSRSNFFYIMPPYKMIISNKIIFHAISSDVVHQKDMDFPFIVLL